MLKKYSLETHRGSALIFILVIGGVLAFTLTALAELAVTHKRLVETRAARTSAFHIAEAGIQYYRWHLAHAQDDFMDGTGTAGPYVHPYSDRFGNRIGTFTLTITPPPLGSTVVTIVSRGTTDRFPNVTRSIQTTLARQSIARYAFVANDVMRFGSGTTVTGPVHVNGGIRFDGVAMNLVTSAVEQYADPDSDDCTTGPDFGVRTCVSPKDPSPPALLPSRPDVFHLGRSFPVQRVDFDGLATDLLDLKTKAKNGGIYLAASGTLGYHLILNTDDTVTILKVIQIYPSPNKNCYDSQNQPGWGLWSRQSEMMVIRRPLPGNGVLFVEDDVWIDGKIDGAKVTVIAGRFLQGSPANIALTQSLRYTNYDGRDVIGLIAQNNIIIGFKSNTTIQIDAALIAKEGRVGRFYYQSACGAEYIRNSIILTGMIASNKRYGFSYTGGTGYTYRTITYDGNLLYTPPPFFPITTDAYTVLTWEEML